MNGLSLAYLGDAYYELVIRKYLIDLGITKIEKLHNEAVKYTSNAAQSTIMKYLLNNDKLTEEEISAFKKGRNSAHFGRKNVDIVTYQLGTGFESLIGYLCIKNESRSLEIIKEAIEIIKSGE